MPAARTDIDEPGICARIALQGIRPTAEATGLPKSTVHEIAKRNNVTLPDKPMRLVPYSNQGHIPDTSGQLRSGQLSGQPAHAVVTDAVSANGSEGRLLASVAGVNALRRVVSIQEADADAGLVALDSALTAAKLLQTSNVPGFERQPDQRSAGLVNIAILGVSPDQLRVEIPSSTALPGTVEE